MFVITKILAHAHVKDVLFDLLYEVFFFDKSRLLIYVKTHNNHRRESEAPLREDLTGTFGASSWFHRRTSPG